MYGSSKTALAAKQFESKIIQHTIDNERLFRLYLIKILQSDSRGKSNKRLLDQIARRIPTDAILRRTAAEATKDPIDESDLEQLNALFFENKLLETSGRSQLLEIFNKIPSSFYDLEELDIGINFDAFLAHCKLVADRNNSLHQQLASLSVQTQVRTPFYEMPKEHVENLLQSREIIDEVTQHRATHSRPLSQCIEKRPEIPSINQIRERVSMLVHSSLEPSSKHTEYSKVERAALINRAKAIDNDLTPDLSTLESKLQRLTTKYATLLETKHSLETQLNGSSRRATSRGIRPASSAAQIDAKKSRMMSLNDIIGQNTATLKKTLRQNKELQRQIQQRNLEFIIMSDQKLKQ